MVLDKSGSMGDAFTDLQNAAIKIGEQVNKSEVIDDFYCITYDD
jgi:hypothetical protein